MITVSKLPKDFEEYKIGMRYALCLDNEKMYYLTKDALKELLKKGSSCLGSKKREKC